MESIVINYLDVYKVQYFDGYWKGVTEPFVTLEEALPIYNELVERGHNCRLTRTKKETVIVKETR